jgi:flagellum-specific peptidoglycan hydrolase FlgJ
MQVFILLATIFINNSLFCNVNAVLSNISVDNYPAAKKISDVSHIAIWNMVEYGVPFSITAGQILLESGITNENPYGSIMAQNNNLFGIKYYGLDIPTRIPKSVRSLCINGFVYAKDDCGRCKFAKFRNTHFALLYHAHFLTCGDIYTKHLHSNDYKGWALALQEGGYATDPNYAKKLIFVIEKYKLHQIDERIRNFNGARTGSGKEE